MYWPGVKYTVRVGLLVVLMLAASACSGNTLPDRAGAPVPAGKELPTDEFEPAFTFSVGEGWVVAGDELRDVVAIRQPESNLWLGFLNVEEVFDPSEPGKLRRTAAPKDMVAWLRAHPGLESEQPEAARVGGVSGVQFDALVVDAPEQNPWLGCVGACLYLFRLSNGDGIGFEEGEKVRFIILENVRGETVTISFAAAAVEFEEGLPKVQEVLDTVEWVDT